MTVRIARSTARAVIDQIRGGSRSDMTIMLGEHASSPGFTGDEQAVVAQIERALAGDDPKVSADVLQHVSDILSTPMDLGLLVDMGVDPGVVAFHALSMGAIAFTADGRDLQITTRIGDPPRLNFDLGIGRDVSWSTTVGSVTVSIEALPETLGAAIAARLDAGGGVPLREIVSHRLLDAVELRVAGITMREWGGAWLKLAPHPLLEDHAVRSLVESRG